MVYIREAHASDEQPAAAGKSMPGKAGKGKAGKGMSGGAQKAMGKGGRPALGGGGAGALPQPKTEEERHQAAAKAAQGLKLTMSIVVDDMQDSASKAYAAAPDRLYVIDGAGKVAYQGDHGPKGFKPDEMEKALQALLAKPARAAGKQGSR